MSIRPSPLYLCALLYSVCVGMVWVVVYMCYTVLDLRATYGFVILFCTMYVSSLKKDFHHYCVDTTLINSPAEVNVHSVIFHS